MSGWNWNDIIPLGMSVLTFVFGTVAWYKGAVKRQYAAERDFGILKDNYSQLNQQLVDIENKIDELNRELLRINALLQPISIRLIGPTSGGYFDPHNSDR